jgi:hypothetical protein
MAGQFTLDLRRFAARAGGNARLVVKKVVIDCGASIVMKTPVGDPLTWANPGMAPAGYVGGRARGSWQYGRGTATEGEPGGVDASGSGPLGRISAGAQAGDAADVHFITSDVPYMRPLEYEGHSGQAPDGMVRKTISEYQAFVAAAVRDLP